MNHTADRIMWYTAIGTFFFLLIVQSSFPLGIPSSFVSVLEQQGYFIFAVPIAWFLLRLGQNYRMKRRYDGIESLRRSENVFEGRIESTAEDLVETTIDEQPVPCYVYKITKQRGDTETTVDTGFVSHGPVSIQSSQGDLELPASVIGDLFDDEAETISRDVTIGGGSLGEIFGSDDDTMDDGVDERVTGFITDICGSSASGRYTLKEQPLRASAMVHLFGAMEQENGIWRPVNGVDLRHGPFDQRAEQIQDWFDVTKKRFGVLGVAAAVFFLL